MKPATTHLRSHARASALTLSCFVPGAARQRWPLPKRGVGVSGRAPGHVSEPGGKAGLVSHYCQACSPGIERLVCAFGCVCIWLRVPAACACATACCQQTNRPLRAKGAPHPGPGSACPALRGANQRTVGRQDTQLHAGWTQADTRVHTCYTTRLAQRRCSRRHCCTFREGGVQQHQERVQDRHVCSVGHI